MNERTYKDEEQPIDPVCGMTVSVDTEHHCKYSGIHYYFCCEHCLLKFKEHPKQYIAEEPSLHLEMVRKSTTYTCPMHPDIVQDHPGNCPKCGMALEPLTAEVVGENPELVDMSRRFWISVGLAVPVFILAMVADLTPEWLPSWLSMKLVQWIEFVLATPVVLWGGWPFFARGWQSIRTRNLNMFTLIALGVSVAWSYSVVALLFPQMFPAVLEMEGGLVDVYFEAASMIRHWYCLDKYLSYGPALEPMQPFKCCWVWLRIRDVLS